MALNDFTDEDRAFAVSRPVARLATADCEAAPHVLPICFFICGDTLYFTADEKPKAVAARRLKRLRNIAENPQAAVIIDRYAEDWSQLGWVMLRGAAEIIDDGAEYDAAQAGLIARYPQYEAMQLSGLPVVALRIQRVSRWGNLRPDP